MKINIAEKLALFDEHFSPKRVAHVNDTDMLIEPRGTLNTGNVTNERTVQEPQAI